MIEVILKIMNPCLNLIYMFFKIFPTQKKVVMISRQSNEVNMDFKLIGDQLEKKYKVVYLCKTLNGGVKSKVTARVKYGVHMFKQMYHLATSKVCILDSYCPTISILKHKKSLTVIQIWHSIGTLKKFGYTSLNKKEGSNVEIAKILKMHKNYDIICASSDAYKEDLAKGFGYESNKVKILTLPRIDLLNNKKYEKEIKEKIYKKYPQLNSNKKNILYAPTFRKNEKGFNQAFKDLLKNVNFKKYNLVVKLHPLSKINIISNGEAIIDQDFSTYEMLFISDICVSDYSCIIYEAGLRNIPLYFYNYDFDSYIDARGLAIDYNELPGYKAKTGKELAKCLEKKYDYVYEKKFINKYVENQKNCTRKIVQEIEKYM